MSFLPGVNKHERHRKQVARQHICVHVEVISDYTESINQKCPRQGPISLTVHRCPLEEEVAPFSAWLYLFLYVF